MRWLFPLLLLISSFGSCILHFRPTVWSILLVYRSWLIWKSMFHLAHFYLLFGDLLSFSEVCLGNLSCYKVRLVWHFCRSLSLNCFTFAFGRQSHGASDILGSIEKTGVSIMYGIWYMSGMAVSGAAGRSIIGLFLIFFWEKLLELMEIDFHVR